MNTLHVIRSVVFALLLGTAGVSWAQAQTPQQEPPQPTGPQQGAPQQGASQPGGTAVIEVDLEGEALQVRGQCPELRFSLGGFVVTTDARTEFDDGGCEDVVEGARVEVDGIAGAEGGVRAREVDLD